MPGAATRGPPSLTLPAASRHTAAQYETREAIYAGPCSAELNSGSDASCLQRRPALGQTRRWVRVCVCPWHGGGGGSGGSEPSTRPQPGAARRSHPAVLLRPITWTTRTPARRAKLAPSLHRAAPPPCLRGWTTMRAQKKSIRDFFSPAQSTQQRSSENAPPRKKSPLSATRHAGLGLTPTAGSGASSAPPSQPADHSLREGVHDQSPGCTQTQVPTPAAAGRGPAASRAMSAEPHAPKPSTGLDSLGGKQEGCL